MTKQETYKIERHPDLPVIIAELKASFVFAKHVMPLTLGVKKLLDLQTSPVFYIFDIRDWNVMSFSELMQAAAQAAKGKDTNFHHPMNRCTLMITTDKIVNIAAKGMQTDAYDNANIKVLESVDDAIAFITQELSKDGSPLR